MQTFHHNAHRNHDAPENGHWVVFDAFHNRERMFDLGGFLGLLDDLSLAHLLVGRGDGLEVRGLHLLAGLCWEIGHRGCVAG